MVTNTGPVNMRVLSGLTDKKKRAGPIMKLYTPNERLYASNYAVAKDLFDEKRFEKAVTGPLKEVRHLAGDGLFTAYPGEHNWECACFA